MATEREEALKALIVLTEYVSADEYEIVDMLSEAERTIIEYIENH
jgi:hypothetical protein